MFLRGSPHNISSKFSFANLVNVFEIQNIFLKKGEGVINMKRFIEQENVYKLDSWPLQKKVPPHIDKS